ncbi:hypothetical protein CLV30_11767 [Haloactinopolyspora alba]|uniref:Uncharacterized protein n=1 Tax=Haloactinopolyspora alba TaxID=648780 RepID=A0A2P8DRF5_9ACTN|nr:hypothetical protein [Haloactinopolyspora alba]PSK99764.1 hypothetical protein CLV30_11767 [Haloactinopolyspora alba]
MKRRARPTAADERGVPAVLLDPDAAVWHDRAAHVDFMAARGWSPDVRDRFAGSHAGAPPAARRQVAVAAWAVEHGISDVPGGHPDWHQLREMGLHPS